MKLVCVFFLLSLFLSLDAQTTDWAQYLLSTSAPVFNQDEKLDVQESTVGQEKNLKVALLMSAVIPGSGQYYAKSYWKAAGFLALEAVAWSIYVSGNKNGKKIEDEFHNYAQSHWSESDYWKWISYHSGIAYNEENMEALREWEHGEFSHGLHREKDQQYFEMIGKYHQFNWGWDDFREGRTIDITHEQMTATKMVSDNRYHYESRRNASNDAFKNATTGATIALFNHLLCAVDAAWTTSRYNKKIQTTVRLEPFYYCDHVESLLTLRVNW